MNLIDRAESVHSPSSLYEVFGERVEHTDPRPPPGTIFTATIETIDNDVASSVSTLLSASIPPQPGTITETVETVDEDAASSLTVLF